MRSVLSCLYRTATLRQVRTGSRRGDYNEPMQLDLPLDRGSLDSLGQYRADFTLAQIPELSDVQPRVIVVTGDGRLGTHGQQLWCAPPGWLTDECYLLGRDEGGEVWLAQPVGTNVEMPPEVAFRSVTELASDLDGDQTLMAAQAGALARWHHTERFCGRCGGKLRPIEAGWAARCQECATVAYPRTDPAVIVLILDRDGRALLAHNAAWETGRYSLVAGFVEAGESPRRAVKREVEEEVGLLVDQVEYLGAQPWPGPHSLMIAFQAVVVGEAQRPRPDGEEIDDAQFFSRNEYWEALASGKMKPPNRNAISTAVLSAWLGKELPYPQEGAARSHVSDPNATIVA